MITPEERKRLRRLAEYSTPQSSYDLDKVLEFYDSGIRLLDALESSEARVKELESDVTAVCSESWVDCPLGMEKCYCLKEAHKNMDELRRIESLKGTKHGG